MLLLSCTNLSKNFGTLPVLQGLSFTVASGEVVGVTGRSGAGKSVLAMILAGVVAPGEGELNIAGRRARWPFSAHEYGAVLIPQRPELVEQLDISANIFLGSEIGWPQAGGWLRFPSRAQMERAAQRILEGLDVRFASLRERVSNLSSEQRQLIAIARALVGPARLIIADDPTVQLSYTYQQKFLDLVRSWQRQGTSVIFTSNNLDYLFAVADRILVLREGRLVADVRTDAASREEVVAAVVGTTDHQQLTPIIWALDSYYRAREQAERLLRRQELLEENLAAHDTLNRQLVAQLARQLSALDSANLALQDAQRRLLIEREGERKALARELHDEVIQDLLSINYELEALEVEQEPEVRAGELSELRENIRRLIGDVRRICGNLRPPTLDSLGLGAAIQSYARDWSARTGIAVELNIDIGPGRMPEAIELSIFRIVQEGLSNVRKHAHASQVSIALQHTSPRSLMVSIADNGRGLDRSDDLGRLAAEGHYGLLGISERVALMEGRLSLQSPPGNGLRIQVEIPHPRVDVAGQTPGGRQGV